MPKPNKDFYNYFSQNLIKGFIYLGLLIAALVIFKSYFESQYDALQHWVSDDYWLMFIIFLISEIFVGIVPPEVFMVWTKDDPATLYVWVIVAMTVLSLLAGWINYSIGKLISSRRFFRRYFKRRLRKYSERYEQYGSGFIVVAALTPLPFALVSLITGALSYPSKKYLLYSSFRVLRFVVYGLIIWNLGDVV
ncbi:YqaA family protein [Roseivirga pacifica]|uniref:YqaA family protein n=1 Tax=Roseivirga pacifica TaxID=1267423 RepID=UPI003BB19B79